MKMVINGEEPTEIVATIAEYSGRKKKQGLSKRRKKPKLLRNCYDPKNFVHPEIMFEAFKSQDGGLSLQLHLAKQSRRMMEKFNSAEKFYTEGAESAALK